MVMSDKIGHLNEEAEKRKQRLEALKNRKRRSSGGGENSSDDGAAAALPK